MFRKMKKTTTLPEYAILESPKGESPAETSNRKVILMKNDNRTSMIISGTAMSISLLGCIIWFVQTKTFDSAAGGMLAANTALYCYYSDAYRKQQNAARS